MKQSTEPCPVCGKPFRSVRTSRGTRTKTCSRSCGSALRCGVQPTGRPSRAGERLCEVCGQKYKASYGEQRTCSRACGLKIHRYTPPSIRKPKLHTIYLRCCIECGAWFTGRGRLTCSEACAYEAKRAYDLAYNKTRAGYVGRSTDPAPCLTCGEGSFPYPLARGGDDTRANVQLACFLCNSIKGDRGGNEQLALIG